MVDIPTLPILADGAPPDPGVLTQWLASLPAGVDEVLLEPVPAISAHLPDVLTAAGITQVTTSACAHGLHWLGPSGRSVSVNGDASGQSLRGDLRGDLPGGQTQLIGSDPERLHGMRLRWAAAAGLTWSDGAPAAQAGDPFTAWNPLPLARRAVVAFPAGSGPAPWALRDPRNGARHPLQVVEGALGPEWVSSLPLAASAVARFVPEKDPVDGGAPWEVSEEILDNGLVRLEFDLFGRIERLCFGGHFVPLSAPLLRAGRDDEELLGAPARFSVQEAGPVRARISVTRELPEGVLHLTFTLHAFDPCLRVSIAWDGDNRDRWLDCATTLAAQPWQRSVGWGSERIREREDSRWHHGVSWVRLDDGDGGGLVVAGPRPWSASVAGGLLRVRPQPGLSLVLADPRRCDPATLLDRWLMPAQAVGPSDDAQPYRLVLPDGVAPMWLRRTNDGACAVTLAELSGRAARGWLYPQQVGRAWLTSLRAHAHRDLVVTPEGDGFQIDLPPGGIGVLHWSAS